MEEVVYIRESRNLLTKGKSYKVVKAIEVGDKIFYRLINNSGEVEAYYEKSFLTRSEIRNRQLNKLDL